MKNNIKSIADCLQDIAQDINWDNFTDKGTSELWKTSQVLYCRLDWVKDNLPDDEDNEELQETIELLQELVESIQKANIQGD